MNAAAQRLGGLLDWLLNLRHVMTGAFILVLAVLAVAFALVHRDTRFMLDRINSDYNQQQLILARQAASEIDALLLDFEIELESLRQFRAGQSGGDLSAAIRAAFDRLRPKGALEIGLLDSRGQMVEACNGGAAPLPLPPPGQAGLRWNKAGRMVLGPLRVLKGADNKTIIASPVGLPIDFEGNPPGTLFAWLDVAELVVRAAGAIRAGKLGHAWVIDDSGMFLYHPETGFVGKDAFTARKERAPGFDFGKINWIMKERMLKGDEGTEVYESGWHLGVVGPVTKLIAYTPLRSSALPPGVTWSVAVYSPISEVADVARRIQARRYAAEGSILAGVMIFALLALVYHHHTSHALKERVGRQEEYISGILQSSRDAIIFIDNDNRVQVWNTGAELLFGYSAPEMLGQTFHRLIPPDLDPDRELEAIRQEVLRKGHIGNYVAPRVTKDGRRISIDLSRTLVRSPQGEVIGSVAIMKDVTEKMEMDQRIYNTEKLASIGILAAGVAHEINNPLGIILGFADLLKERFPPGSPEYEDLKIIEDNGYHAKGIVENLLGFARVSEGTEDAVDVRQSLDRVVNIVSNTLKTEKIDLAAQWPDSLPRVRGDAREFQQVIFNLINNAVAAMKETGGTLALRAWADDAWVRVSVADTGVGVPDKIKPRIFDPFFTTKKVGEGTGLGLSLCYGIVKKYGGKIDFVSVSAEDDRSRPSGSVFTVSMPAQRDEPPPREEGRP